MPSINPLAAHEAEVVARRDALVATIDQLSDALNPRIQVTEATRRAKEVWHEAVRPAPDAAPERVSRARALVAGTGVVAVGAAALVIRALARRH